MDDWITHMGGGLYYWPYCYVKLATGVSPARVEAQMDRILARQVLTSPKNPFREVLQPMADIHFNNDSGTDCAARVRPSQQKRICDARFSRCSRLCASLHVVFLAVLDVRKKP